ncbi:hypothetical protein ACJ72_04674 [Emergomyces africanus]|uniref:HNH nuclease domain-containing protein n=1 Tax=Emergomyces africanus TaxID=1955775 RepID=A0A1B7NW39_9EURO|nr:hypothetical protein ACJ72_04674 [Emergomyces africanus]
MASSKPLSPPLVVHGDIVEKFKALKDTINGRYNRCLLVQYTYEYSRSVESKDMFLRAFFDTMPVTLDGNEDIDFSNKNLEQQLREAFIDFADYLLDNFFFPLKSAGKKTPRSSPAPHSTFDLKEAATRIQKNGDSARDDDGALLKDDLQAFETLEVAHILPHSLIQIKGGSELTQTKEAAIAILNMFDSGVAHVIEGCEIDRSFNAISLTPTLHSLFGDFQIFFEPVSTELPLTYTISSYLSPLLLRDPKLPVTREVYLSEDISIDPPLPRLLAIHSAIVHILHLSAAGEYIDRLLRDQEQIGPKADGSTELGRLIKLRLSGWITGVV